MIAANRNHSIAPPIVAAELVDERLVARFLLASRVCAVLVMLLGVTVLLGWQFDLPLFKSILPELGAMAPGSAIAFLLAGLTLLLLGPTGVDGRRVLLARLLPMPVLLIGGLTLAEYLLSTSLGIDELFYADVGHWVQTSHPGRMSLVAAIGFLLLGSALLLVGWNSRDAQRGARVLAGATILMSMVGLLGFLYGRASLYAMPVFTGVAAHTLVGMTLLAAGLLALQPARGLASMLVSSGTGGQVSRRFAPYALLVPLVLGWLRLEGERAGLYETAMGVDLMMVTMVVLFIALIWWNARLLDASTIEARRAEIALRRYADEVSDLYEHAPCGYHSLDRDGAFVRINDTELSWLGYGREEVLGKMKMPDLLTPLSREVFRSRFEEFRKQGRIGDVELEMVRKDGSILPVSVSATAVLDAKGEYLMSRSTVFDITARKRSEEALRLSEGQARLRLTEIEQIYRYAPVGLFIFDREYRFLRINERMAEINGFPPEAHIGKSMWEIVPDLAEQLKELYRPVYERGEPVLDVEIHGRTPSDPDRPHDWLASYFPLKSEQGEFVGMIGAVVDITERKRIEQALRASEAEVRALSLVDPLTGLANRRRLDEKLDSEVHRLRRYGGRLSAVMADLDRFKLVNDQYGHQVGDALLQEFARIIAAHCRDTDLGARFGGEEFLILMPEVGAEEARTFAERIRVALAQAIVPPLPQPATASFGVAEFEPGEDGESLLRRADQALYRAKAAGRNQVALSSAIM